GFIALFQEYLMMISYKSEIPVSDFDLIFSNILVEDDRWNVIDYEWTFGKTIPPRELAYRAYYCYILGAEKRRKFGEEQILKLLQMTEADAQKLREEESEFQAYVTGERVPMGVLRNMLGFEMLAPQVWEAKYKDDNHKQRVQVYEDTGSGFSEAGSYFLNNPYQNDGHGRIMIDVPEDVVVLRVDPMLDSCIVTIDQISWNQEVILPKSKRIMTNGIRYGEDTFVFETKDPNINIDLHGLEHRVSNELVLELTVSRIAEKNAHAFKKNSKFWLGKETNA
ncbi:MAG: hypothetical protein PHT89_10115, partial [Lachnospiraceae bacterium]|nr:hypothetical protein [Lachnospiraceae bacterium]